LFPIFKDTGYFMMFSQVQDSLLIMTYLEGANKKC
jgi:hypothetical protein